MSADGCLGLSKCFAGLNALVPRVIHLDITITSAVRKPRTTATATTTPARFGDDAAFEACGTDGPHRCCWCVYVVLYVMIGQNTKIKTRNESSIGLREDLSTLG